VGVFRVDHDPVVTKAGVVRGDHDLGVIRAGVVRADHGRAVIKARVVQADHGLEDTRDRVVRVDHGRAVTRARVARGVRDQAGTRGKADQVEHVQDTRVDRVDSAAPVDLLAVIDPILRARMVAVMDVAMKVEEVGRRRSFRKVIFRRSASCDWTNQPGVLAQTVIGSHRRLPIRNVVR
ncbi:MAG: hypothetical protein ACR2IE_19730, partial [Candidatus Sumerlaeaceae bacterium]